MFHPTVTFTEISEKKIPNFRLVPVTSVSKIKTVDQIQFDRTLGIGCKMLKNKRDMSLILKIIITQFTVKARLL